MIIGLVCNILAQFDDPLRQRDNDKQIWAVDLLWRPPVSTQKWQIRYSMFNILNKLVKIPRSRR